MDHDEILQSLNTTISSIAYILEQSKEVKEAFSTKIEHIEKSFHQDISAIQDEIDLHFPKRSKTKAQHCLNFHLNKHGNASKRDSKCEQEIRIEDLDEESKCKTIESLLEKFSMEENSLDIKDQSFENETYEEKVEDLQKRKSEEIVKLISSFQPSSLKSMSTAPQRLGVASLPRIQKDIENLLKDERDVKSSRRKDETDLHLTRNKRNNDNMIKNLMKHGEELFTNLEDLPLSWRSEGESASKQEFSTSRAISESNYSDDDDFE
jgi:hypothetical protein